ncbi:MAG TPA: M48 family metalloprotease, partial [Burkholderiaceae bacterium]|nr:M48 family metalloprotease [Burkholderiaceae bacterium]
MTTRHYADWVARLEVQSRQQPRWYRTKVVLWVLMGFGLVALLLGMSGLGLAVLAGGALWMLTAGPKSLLVLFKLGKLLLLLALPLGRMIWTGTRALLVRLPPPQGQPLLREEAPQLFEALDRMQSKLKGPAFHQVLLIDEMNAAVVQRPLFGWIGFPRNTLLLGLPLLESLSAREALAVVAHEYGHLAAEHSRFGAYIYRLRSSWRQIQDLTLQWEGLTGRFMRGLVGLYAPAFDAYTFVLARAQEYEADRTGARLLGAEAMASALKRLPLAAAHEQQVYGQLWKRARQEAGAPKDAAFAWAQEAPSSCRQQDAPLWLGRALERQADLLDTHPSLSDRLRRLRQGSEAPMPLRGPSAAEAWLVKRLPAWRRHFSEAWAARTQDVWEQRHAALQSQREQLRILQGRTAC